MYQNGHKLIINVSNLTQSVYVCVQSRTCMWTVFWASAQLLWPTLEKDNEQGHRPNQELCHQRCQRTGHSLQAFEYQASQGTVSVSLQEKDQRTPVKPVLHSPTATDVCHDLLSSKQLKTHEIKRTSNNETGWIIDTEMKKKSRIYDRNKT